MGRTGYLWYEDDQLQEPVVEWYDSIKHETENAWLMGDEGTKENDMWFPKSQCSVRKMDRGYEVTVPFWLAKKKGLV